MFSQLAGNKDAPNKEPVLKSQNLGFLVSTENQVTAAASPFFCSEKDSGTTCNRAVGERSSNGLHSADMCAQSILFAFNHHVFCMSLLCQSVNLINPAIRNISDTNEYQSHPLGTSW